MTSVSVLSIPTPAVPRGSILAASVFRAFLSLFDFRPAAPTGDVRAIEAAEVRAMARQIEAYDPRFAADLFAAADRHQG